MTFISSHTEQGAPFSRSLLPESSHREPGAPFSRSLLPESSHRVLPVGPLTHRVRCSLLPLPPPRGSSHTQALRTTFSSLSGQIGCVYILGGLSLCCCVWAFFGCNDWGLLSTCSAQASHCSDFSFAEHGLWVHGCSNVTDRLSCPLVCGIFLDQGWKPCLLIGRQILNHWTTGEVPDRILIEILIAYITILECEVKWPLGSITMNKACGDDEILAELFQILKDAIAKVLHSICQQWPQD